MILLAILLAAFPPKATTHVKIDGTTIRVTRKGDDVAVASKSLIVMHTMALRDKYRQAVLQVTGCKLIDELWQGNEIHGRLDCPNPPE